MDDVTIEEPVAVLSEVPWGMREAWLGVGSLVGWVVLALGLGAALDAMGVDIDAGWIISVGEAALLLPVWWLVMRKYEVGWDGLGLRKYEKGTLRVGCVTLILFYMGLVAYRTILQVLGVEGETGLLPLFSEATSPLLIFFGGIVVAPVVEEIFFRGFLFAGLRDKYGWQRAATISAVLFAAIHLQLLNALPIFALGYVFAYLYQRSNSIWPAIILHGTVNTIGLGILYVVTEWEGFW